MKLKLINLVLLYRNDDQLCNVVGRERERERERERKKSVDDRNDI